MNDQGEIDAREDSFNSTADAGQKLLDEGVGAAEDVRGKLEQLAKDKVRVGEKSGERETCRLLFYPSGKRGESCMSSVWTCSSSTETLTR